PGLSWIPTPIPISVHQVVTQFQKRRALSVPKNMGRRIYKTLLLNSTCRGRPFFGRADVRSFQNQTESLPSTKSTGYLLTPVLGFRAKLKCQASTFRF